MKTRLATLLALLAVSTAAPAAIPEACAIVTAEEINTIAQGSVQKTQQRKTGNPSECAFIGAHNAAVLVLSIREVRYAAENELQYERENLEKIYRGKVKWLTTVGENGFWMPVNKQLWFRKGKTLVSIAFARPANQNEVDSAQVARLVDSRLK
jgi:ATP-dependent helicase/DNAse subunit B